MLSPSKGQYLNPFFYHICDRKSKQSTSTSHVYTYFIIWKQLDDFHLYFTMSKSNVKDNLCRSELIKVRLFDENFFRFLQEIIPLWCLDNELRCFGEENAWFISFVINCYVLQIFWVFPCTALCECWLWLWVQTADRITLTRAGLARDSTRFNGSLTAQHSTTQSYV